MPDSIENLQQEKASNGEQEETSKNTESEQIHGLLVSYKDDVIDESIHAALQNKKRVHYKCMDVISNFVGLGTSVGAIYLFRLASVTHASCSGAPHVIACDQGPIEVIKFVPANGGGPTSLLVVIGTARGSIVIFQLSFSDHHSVQDQEIYRAVEFTRSEYETQSIGIKLIEYDQDLFDPCAPFTKLYICDQRNRIFVLEEASINPGFRLLHSHKPAPILSVNESTVHQICAHRSQLLLATDEKAHLFSEYSNELLTIGQRQRKIKGFFGACFYNKYFKPVRLQPPPSANANRLSAYSQQTVYSSTASLAELEQLLIFVARPKFSLWRVNNRRDVEFTHMFREPIRASMASGKRRKIVELHNEPLKVSGRATTPSQVETNNNQGEHGRQQQVDDYASISKAFGAKSHSDDDDDEPIAQHEMPKCDHFEKLVPLFSSTLGNLLLSYTRHEIYVIDPIGAQLIVCHAYEKPIQQVCCSENEIFVMLELGKRQTRVERIILLAPTQFVLELHRLNRFLSLTVFVQLFKTQFMRLMALPLSGPNTITTEGGLLRNIIWNTWRETGQKFDSQPDVGGRANLEFDCGKFKEIVDAIMDESRQFKQSLENLADSRLFFTASHENLERLCSEPYASMVSLDISIANLHTNHVVHFSQEALNRHKSLAKLSQSIMNLSQLRQSSGSARSSLLDLSSQQMKASRELLAAAAAAAAATAASEAINFNDKRVIVEPLRPRINLKDRQLLSAGLSLNKIDEATPNLDDEQVTPVDELAPSLVDGHELNEGPQSPAGKQDELVQAQVLAKDQDDEDPARCPECRWPRARAHLKPMHHSQQIQYSWLQENLLPNFEENIEQIEERAFKHGLWRVVLRCLAFRNQLDDYVRCCLMLDDVTLLNAKRFIITRGCSEDELIDLVFKQLEHKLDKLGKPQHEKEIIMLCLKCGYETIKQQPDRNGDNLDDDNDDESLHGDNLNDGDTDDGISFNLVGLFKILLRKSTDIKRAISILLQYPSLLEKSEIPATFYLEALGLYPRPHRVGTT